LIFFVRKQKGVMTVKSLKFTLSILLVLLLMGGVSWYIERHESTGASASSTKQSDFYYCPMHPWFHQDHPGNCGICGMTLVKKESGTQIGKKSVSDSNESDGLPEALKGLAPVDLSPFKQQLIGLRTAIVEMKPVVRIIRTVGRYSERSAYLVADVYALDVPYMKIGQTAWVSAFSGSGPRLEGHVSQIYPYDGNQSRIRQVRISLSSSSSKELFANVEIKAASQPLLSVPVDAVMTTGLHRYVFVKKSQENFVPTEITLGVQGDNELQVTNGLSEGETVVEGANFMLDADSKLEANFAAIDAENGK
jgi:hypothetical protein